MTGSPRREQLVLTIEIALCLPSDGQCLIKGLLRLCNLLWTQAAVQFVEFRLRNIHRRIRRRERFLVGPRVEDSHARARFDVISFIEVHLRYTAGLTEGQLHLPNVDIAV